MHPRRRKPPILPKPPKFKNPLPSVHPYSIGDAVRAAPEAQCTCVQQQREGVVYMRPVYIRSVRVYSSVQMSSVAITPFVSTCYVYLQLICSKTNCPVNTIFRHNPLCSNNLRCTVQNFFWRFPIIWGLRGIGGGKIRDFRASRTRILPLPL